jgi:hypothetical protein
LWSANWIGQSGSQRIIGWFNNGAVGTALGQANGIQALDRGRQVIALPGDGGFNMLMCEFLTAVHHKLPVKVVVYNNRVWLDPAGGRVDRGGALPAGHWLSQSGFRRIRGRLRWPRLRGAQARRAEEGDQ